jgi:Flp pilus assembly pilin Flp
MMKLFNRGKEFKKDESGAVTVDWVVLTAAIVGIALAMILTIEGGINEAASEIRDRLTDALT